MVAVVAVFGVGVYVLRHQLEEGGAPRTRTGHGFRAFLLVVGVLAALVLGVYGLNRVISQTMRPSDEQMRVARAYLARHGGPDTLHDCEQSATDISRLLCRARTTGGGDVDLRIDFLPSGDVAATCVVNGTTCPWNR